MKPTVQESQTAHTWIAKHLLSADVADLPFSFRYGEQSSAALLGACSRRHETRALDANRTEHALVFSDAATGIEVRCVATEYHDFPAVEWLLNFKNGGTVNTPVLSDIQAVDTVVEPESAPWGTQFTLHYSRGALASPGDFTPLKRVLNPKATFRVQPGGGRSSSEYMPYFNLEIGSAGVVAAIGWTGEWAFRAARVENRVQLQAGMALSHFTLYPGEEVRSPRILLVFWEGERLRGHNLLRSLILAHYRPTANGRPVGGMMCTHTWGSMRIAQHLDNISQVLRHELPIEYYWIDAEWFGKKMPWWEQNGNWDPNPALYPEGLKPIGDACHRTGKKFLLWFEQERVCPDTPIWEEHPEWLLLIDEKDACWSWPKWLDFDDPTWYPAEINRNRISGGEGLFNMGDPAACRFMTDLVSDRITEFGIDVFRQDFNIAPLAFWRANDARLSPVKQDRQGITEIRYVEGMYAFLDELQRRHPHLVIDNCASGGRRLDLEMIRRSVTLTESDSARNTLAQQCQGYGIRLWVPLAWMHDGDIRDNDYELRSRMGVHLGINLIDNKVATPWTTPETPRPMSDDLPFDAMKRKLEQYVKIRHLFLGDYYPLTEFSTTQDAWMACQHDCGDLGEGLVMAFKRPLSPFDTACLQLHGLDPCADYDVTQLDTRETKRVPGRTLLERGLEVHLPGKPDSALIVYRRCPDDVKKGS